MATNVNRYLKAVKLEQSLSAVTPKQAKSLCADKLCLISRHISFRLISSRNSVIQKYLYKRDLTFFNLLAYTGDRAGDLGRLLVNQIYHLPDGSGLLFSLTKGKATNLTAPRVVFLFYSYKAEFCPAKLFVDFLELCKENDLINNNSYVFRNLSGGVAFGGNLCHQQQQMLGFVFT